MPAATRREGAEREAHRALTRIGRRRFLQLGAAAGAGALLPTGCGGVPEWLHPPADVELSHLSPRAYSTFNAAAARIVGDGPDLAIRERRIDAALGADRWLAREPALAGALGVALGLLEYGLPPLVAKWRPFTRLGGGAQDAVLRDLMTSRLDLKQDVFRGIRSLACIAYYSDPASSEWTHHPGPFGTGAVRIADAMRYEPET